jgi:hypothetical protein
MSPLLGNKPQTKGDTIMKKIEIVKFVTVNGCLVPVYASEKEQTASIDVKRIIAGVVFGSLVTAVSALAFMV